MTTVQVLGMTGLIVIAIILSVIALKIRRDDQDKTSRKQPD